MAYGEMNSLSNSPGHLIFFFTDVTVTNRNQSIQIPIWLMFTEPLVCGQDRANTRFDPAWLKLPFS